MRIIDRMVEFGSRGVALVAFVIEYQRTAHAEILFEVDEAAAESRLFRVALDRFIHLIGAERQIGVASVGVQTDFVEIFADPEVDQLHGISRFGPADGGPDDAQTRIAFPHFRHDGPDEQHQPFGRRKKLAGSGPPDIAFAAIVQDIHFRQEGVQPAADRAQILLQFRRTGIAVFPPVPELSQPQTQNDFESRFPPFPHFGQQSLNDDRRRFFPVIPPVIGGHRKVFDPDRFPDRHVILPGPHRVGGVEITSPKHIGRVEFLRSQRVDHHAAAHAPAENRVGSVPRFRRQQEKARFRSVDRDLP